jgi:CRP-like cAMP-binding protein
MTDRSLLSGDLEFISLADLFQILGGSNSTGILFINGEFSPCRGEIHFLEGEPVDATWGAHQGMEAVYALFGWRQGHFEFRPQGFTGNRRIKKSRMEIVLDALRKLDDGQITKVGTPQRVKQDVPLSVNRPVYDLPTITGSMIDYDYILSEERFQPGTRIVSEGSYGNWIWVIMEGSILISRESGGKSTPLYYLGEGAFIGSFEVLLFGDHIRTATVTAEGDVHSALLDTHRLSTELNALSPEFRKYLLEMSARAKEAMDDLNYLLRESDKSPLAGTASSWTSKLSPAYRKETLALEKFQDEYVLLSKTFKSLIQCTASTVSTMATMVSEIKLKTGNTRRRGLHRNRA